MPKRNPRRRIFVVLVDAHRHPGSLYCNRNRGQGSYYVCAKSPRDAEKAVAKHIGKTHGSISCYYEVDKDSDEFTKYWYLATNECEKAC